MDKLPGNVLDSVVYTGLKIDVHKREIERAFKTLYEDGYIIKSLLCSHIGHKGYDFYTLVVYVECEYEEHVFEVRLFFSPGEEESNSIRLRTVYCFDYYEVLDEIVQN